MVIFPDINIVTDELIQRLNNLRIEDRPDVSPQIVRFWVTDFVFKVSLFTPSFFVKQLYLSSLCSKFLFQSCAANWRASNCLYSFIMEKVQTDFPEIYNQFNSREISELAEFYILGEQENENEAGNSNSSTVSEHLLETDSEVDFRDDESRSSISTGIESEEEGRPED